MYDSTGKPSVAKFRCRLNVIRKACQSGKILADHWNPKGRYFQIQRDMIQFYDVTEKLASDFLSFLDHKPPRVIRLQKRG